MVVLTIGDIVGQAGCDHLRRVLPALRQKYKTDVVIANGENSAEGNGIMPNSVKHIFDSGVDVITTGNHALRRRQIYEVLEQQNGVIRPANYHRNAPGAGYYVLNACRFELCVINLQGIAYMQNIQNPFDCIDQLLPQIKTKNIIIDFHAEATAEKLCMGFYLDGKVSAIFGTHTHVPTSDARVLPKGTGYITDIGMCGGLNSVLGVRREEAIEKMKTGLPCRFFNDPDDVRLSGAVFTLDDQTGLCMKVEPIVMV